jgi:hypothetical protein
LISNFIFGQNTLSSDDKIYGLSKFWSDANYNFVYMYKIDQQKWNAAYNDIMYPIKYDSQLEEAIRYSKKNKLK